MKIVCILAGLLLVSGVSHSMPLNSNPFFDQPFPGTWQIENTTSRNNNEAVLTDDMGFSALWQSTRTGPGQFVLSFDVLNELATANNANVFLDTFFATLLFSDSALPPAPSASASSALPLFDMDAGGVFHRPPGSASLVLAPSSGVIGPSAKGANWQHYSLPFATTDEFVTPLFELVDQDFVVGNSSIRIDNVVIQAPAVAEPSALSLIALASLGFFLRRRYRRREPRRVSAHN